MVHDSSGLQQLLDCVFPHDDARDLPSALASVASILDDLGLAYVVAGRVAQARYCRAQFTAIASLRIEERPDLATALPLLRSGFAKTLSAGSTASLELGVITTTAERAFLASSSRVPWLGTELPLASPEHLLWLALHSRRLYAEVDAIDLFNSGHLDWDLFVDIAGADENIVARARRAKLSAAKTEARRR